MDDLMIFDGYVNQLASKNGVLLEWGSQWRHGFQFAEIVFFLDDLFEHINWFIIIFPSKHFNFMAHLILRQAHI